MTQSIDERPLNEKDIAGRCTICNYECTAEEVALAAYIGMFLVRFCETCYVPMYALFTKLLEDDKTDNEERYADDE